MESQNSKYDLLQECIIQHNHITDEELQ